MAEAPELDKDQTLRRSRRLLGKDESGDAKRGNGGVVGEAPALPLDEVPAPPPDEPDGLLDDVLAHVPPAILEEIKRELRILVRLLVAGLFGLVGIWVTTLFKKAGMSPDQLSELMRAWNKSD